MRAEQVRSCDKTPPPELTKQQEAVAAAAAAAAAAKAVAAGMPPDSIHALPAVQGLTSVLGKRPHQQHQPAAAAVPAMMAMGAPLLMAQMGMPAATAAVAGAPVTSGGAGGIEERVSVTSQVTSRKNKPEAAPCLVSDVQGQQAAASVLHFATQLTSRGVGC